MKKVFAVTLCLALILSLLLVGCSKEPTIVGTWKTTIDMGSMLTEYMAEADEDASKYLNFDGISFDLIFEFKEDNSYSVKVDTSSWEALSKKLFDQLKSGLTDYLQDMLKDQGMSLDDYLELAGTDMDELIDAVLEEMDFDAIGEEMSSTGFLQLKDGKLYMGEGKDEEFDADEAFPYTLTKDTLTFNMPEVVDEDIAFVDAMFPMILTRVE